MLYFNILEMEAINGFSLLLRVHSFVSGTNLVKKAIYAMVEGDCDEVSELDPVALFMNQTLTHLHTLHKSRYSSQSASVFSRTVKICILYKINSINTCYTVGIPFFVVDF